MALRCNATDYFIQVTISISAQIPAVIFRFAQNLLKDTYKDHDTAQNTTVPLCERGTSVAEGVRNHREQCHFSGKLSTIRLSEVEGSKTANIVILSKAKNLLQVY